jgi:hypothetical protein
MTIRFLDGRCVEAVLLARTETTMRVVAQGSDDVMEVTDINGTWVSSDCEPVTIEFAWQRHDRKLTVSEADCVCSKDLAARLLRHLFPGSPDDEAKMSPPSQALVQTSSSHLPI